MRIYNTLSRSIEEFKPLNPPNVSLYTCGPTVYDYSHIGHMRAYVVNDILRRTLTYLNFKVNHVMNITDVGHLTGDDDTGEDKLEKGAKKSKKTVWDVVKFYTDHFFLTMDSLNILRANTICPATAHIPEMIAMITKLLEKNYAYETDEAIYFNVLKFKNYGKLSGQSLKEKLKGVREDLYIDPKKRNEADFSLWFKRIGRFADHTMFWNSPWGDGFPGWHIECSAMASKYLGETIDIHTGGIDHIPVHHENEIAQSEGANGKPFVKYWLHYNFLMVDHKKMSKSLGNFYTIEDITKRNFDPLAIRYLFLQTHYRQQMNFTWESATGAAEGLTKLKNIIKNLNNNQNNNKQTDQKLFDTYKKEFTQAIGNDLQTSQALAVLWQVLRSSLSSQEKLNLVLDFDQVLGLKLNEETKNLIPAEIINLAKKRLEFRKAKDFTSADVLRKQIKQKGYLVEDKLINGILYFTIQEI